MKDKLKKFFKMLTVTLVFFVGTVFIVQVDNVCNRTTGYGGSLSISAEKNDDGSVKVDFLGVSGTFDF